MSKQKQKKKAMTEDHEHDEVVAVTEKLMRELLNADIPDHHLVFVAASMLATLEAVTGYTFPDHLMKQLRDSANEAGEIAYKVLGVQ